MDDTQAESQAISNRVRQLMERHGVAKRAQASTLSTVLNLSFSAAHRKMKGHLAWDAKQLQAIASHFGESAGVLVDSTETPAEEGLRAELLIDNEPYRCTVWTGREVTKESAGSFVARPSGDLWHVWPTRTAPTGRLYDVKLLEIRPELPVVKSPCVAILDDDVRHHSADSLARALGDHGFDARPFSAARDLKASLRGNVYDAFILDWVLGPDETAEPLINAIRAESCPSRNALIVILTGKLRDGIASEEDITRVTREHRCQCKEKPVRPSLLAADLDAAFGRRAD
jgi:BetR domain